MWRIHKYSRFIKGNTAQFGKKSQPEFLPQFKVPKMEEYCMYFPFLELRKWGKKAAENRRRNCAVLPLIIRVSSVAVSTMSVSCSPLVKLSSRLISAFLAVQGMMDTTNVFFSSGLFSGRR